MIKRNIFFPEDGRDMRLTSLANMVKAIMTGQQ